MMAMASRASRSAPVDGFRLTFDRFGTPGAAPVVLLHGWPGSRHDYRELVPLLLDNADLDVDVVVPDLRGFGNSDKHAVSVSHFYSASAQAASVVGLIRELEHTGVVIAGYDVGSRVAQSVARMYPDLVAALVLSPPLPGAGERVLTARAQSEFWYQAFHQLPLSAELIDGDPDAVRGYLTHFWAHWSGPGFTLADDDLEVLVADYALPGAFTASINWYRAGAGTIAQSLSELPAEQAIKIHAPADVLWPRHDPLFPPEWSDRLEHYFTDVTLHMAEDAGHFTPLECPDLFARLVLERLHNRRR
jgi:pimeloyl-ACP methyl ester carboxylesterase